MRWGARLGMVMVTAAVLGAAAGCGGSGSSSSGSKTSTSTTPAPNPLTMLVRRYFADMGAQRVDAAMGLRCSADRKQGDQLKLFENETKRFVARNGRPSVVSVTTTAAPGVAMPAGVTRGRAVTVGIVYRARSAGTVTILSGTEHGVLRLCGYAAVTSARLRANPPPLTDLGPTAVPPHALVPDPPEPGSTVTTDEAYRSSHPVGVSGWFRSWRVGSYGGDSITAERFSSPEAARAANVAERRRLVADGLAQFSDPALPNVVGVRVLSEDWLWIQTPDVGPYIDEIDLQFGSTAIIVSVSVLPVGSDHARVIGLATGIVRRADAAVPA